MLEDDVLGQWAMALGFITMVTPMLLLGLPGSLPRYVAAYLNQGHLKAFLRRILWLTGVLSCAGFATMLLLPEIFGWLIFREPTSVNLVVAVALTVVSITIFNSMNELIASLRQVRVVSIMQFINSVSFTVIAIAWLYFDGSLLGLIYSFAASCLIGTLPAWWVLAHYWHVIPHNTDPLNAPSMWKRVLPYAAALWVMNLLANAFELSDRYMILHFSAAADLGQSLVGQYHSARLIPALLLSLAAMASGILLPYLTSDWEAGRHQAVRDRLRKILLAVACLFTAGGAAALWISPWMFDTLLAGRYSGGLAVMPMAFTFSIWGAIAAIAQNYLWVAEKGKYVGWALGIGLVTNLLLNHLLLPILGLKGAVIATMVSNLIVLVGIWVAMRGTGFRWDSSLIWTTLLPATLLYHPLAAILCVAAVAILSEQTRGWIVEGLQIIDPRQRLANRKHSCESAPS